MMQAGVPQIGNLTRKRRDSVPGFHAPPSYGTLSLTDFQRMGNRQFLAN